MPNTLQCQLAWGLWFQVEVAGIEPSGQPDDMEKGKIHVTTIDLNMLELSIQKDAAIRRLQKLQPIGGSGDKIFPPTYPPVRRGAAPRHVFERRRVDGNDIWCVLIDSVQSQANRLEEALLAATEGYGKDEQISLPYVTVDFHGQGLEPLGRITSLDAPHRIYDAILRDSLLCDTPFMESSEGQRLARARPTDAKVLLELSPTALLFGAWHSQGDGGGLGAKFPRVIVSEIMGINTPVEIADYDKTEIQTAGRRTGSRIDPLGVLRKVKIYRGASASDWSMEKSAASKGAKLDRPSTINHGNIAPSVTPLGVTCDYVEHRAAITLAGLRRLRFGSGEQEDIAGRTLIAALGLLALTEQDARGYALRSRCDLVCDGSAPFALVGRDGSTEELELGRSAARALYQEAYAKAETAGFKFRSLTLQPQAKLVEIVRSSRTLALEGKGRESDGEE